MWIAWEELCRLGTWRKNVWASKQYMRWKFPIPGVSGQSPERDSQKSYAVWALAWRRGKFASGLGNNTVSTYHERNTKKKGSQYISISTWWHGVNPSCLSDSLSDTASLPLIKREYIFLWINAIAFSFGYTTIYMRKKKWMNLHTTSDSIKYKYISMHCSVWICLSDSL